MSNAYRMAVTGTVNGDPSEIFRIVTGPQMHVEIDGSGMLETALDPKRLEAIGDTFEIAVDREPLGDIPMGKYEVLNTVTRIVPDALLEWNVGSAEHGAFGHVYGWEISALNTDESEVTNYCDWTEISEDMRDRFPIVPREMMERSVEYLAALMGQASTESAESASHPAFVRSERKVLDVPHVVDRVVDHVPGDRIDGK